MRLIGIHSVSILTRLQGGKPRNRGLIPGWGRILPVQTGSATSRSVFPRRWKWSGRAANHSPPSSAEVKNEWICTSTSPCAPMACTGTKLLLTFIMEEVTECVFCVSALPGIGQLGTFLGLKTGLTVLYWWAHMGSSYSTSNLSITVSCLTSG
jgi:hypothetical protein